MRNSNQINTKAIFKHAIENKLLPEDTDYVTFYNVVREFHKEIAIKIMNGYEFKPGYLLGNFHIVKDLRKGKTINWGASNKRKQELIDQGITPFNKATAPNGVEWFIYYTDNKYYRWRWLKDIRKNFTKRMKYYMFSAAANNRKALGKIVKANQDIILENYVTYK